MASRVRDVTTFPAPSRKDHQQFVEVEGWRLLREVGHHFTYELDLPAGQTLRTPISHSINRTNYGSSLWAHILHNQLCVSAEAFWACVTDGKKPDRGEPPSAVESLPTELAWLLINKVGLTETDVAVLSKEDAIDRLNRYWIEGA
jgi:hypothetical protein